MRSAQRLPPLRSGEPFHRREQRVDAAVSGDVEHRLVSGAQRAPERRLDVGGWQIQAACPAAPIGVGVVHRANRSIGVPSRIHLVPPIVTSGDGARGTAA